MRRREGFDRWQCLSIAVVGGGAGLLAAVAPLAAAVAFLLLGTLWLVVTPRSRVRPERHTGPRVLTDGGEREIAMVTAVIRPGKINAVKQALAEAGTPSLTVSNVSGRGTQPTETGRWRGEEYIVDLHQKVKVEVVVPDEETETVIDAILGAAHTGEPGDGKIWVLPVRDAVRVSTAERGPDAI